MTTLKEKSGEQDVPEMSERDEEPEFADAKQAEEWKEMRDLARSVFYVYFTNNDCDDEIAHMRESQESKKKWSLLKKINGTMPWLPTLISGSSAPKVVKAPILFMEASFRGIAQVRTLTTYFGCANTLKYKDHSHNIVHSSILFA